MGRRDDIKDGMGRLDDIEDGMERRDGSKKSGRP